MMNALLTTVLVASVGISSSVGFMLPSKTLEELRSEVDEGLADEMSKLLNAQPGNPHDAEIWALICRYGIFHFVQQERVHIGIAAQEIKLRPEIPSYWKTHFRGEHWNFYIALAACIPESITQHFCPSVRVQAMNLAQIYSYLHIDVEELCTRFDQIA